MKRIAKCLIAGAMMALAAACSAPKSEIDKKVDELMKQMTLKEKIGQMNQVSDAPWVPEVTARGEIGSVLNCVDPDVINAIQKAAVEESRLGIPVLIARDVIHGFHTMFPIPLGQAATFNPEIVAATLSSGDVTIAKVGF